MTNDNEIIKALEQWIKNYDGSFVNFKILANALDLITRQQAEIENLKVENQSLRGAANSFKMHYEEAQAEIERLKEQIVEVSKTIKSVALKEFAERLKEQYAVYNGMEYVKVDLKTLLNTIDNLVKEMVGDENGTT